MGEERPTPQEQVRRLYDEGEARTAKAMEELVGSDSFGELLARVTENVMSVTRIGNELADLAVRNLRLAGRGDIARLGRQLARTEDKLEMVLQEVERLQDRLDAEAGAAPARSTPKQRSSNSSDGRRRAAGARRRSTSGSKGK
jgi:hypothetical protein